MNWFLKALKQYTDFKGRARRKEFWMFLLIYFVIYFGLTITSIILGLSLLRTLANIFHIGTIIPYIAVGVRRMHDVGKSGWFILVPIYNLILFCTDGEHGPNEYGENPKGIGNNGNIDQIGTE